MLYVNWHIISSVKTYVCKMKMACMRLVGMTSTADHEGWGGVLVLKIKMDRATAGIRQKGRSKMEWILNSKGLVFCCFSVF